MGLDTNAVRRMLDNHDLRGRSAAEAAGESKWLLDVDVQSGIISKQPRQEGIEEIDRWLEERTGDGFPSAKLIADAYADFLVRTVAGSNALTALDDALSAWRLSLGSS